MKKIIVLYGALFISMGIFAMDFNQQLEALHKSSKSKKYTSEVEKKKEPPVVENIQDIEIEKDDNNNNECEKLFEYIRFKDLDNIKKLFSKEENIKKCLLYYNEKDNFLLMHRTALGASSHRDLEILRFLIEKAKEQNILKEALLAGDQLPFNSHNKEEGLLLLEAIKSANLVPQLLNEKDSAGNTILDDSATFGNADVIKSLLDLALQESNVKVNFPLILYRATAANNYDGLKVILQRAIDQGILLEMLDTPYKTGKTLMQYARSDYIQRLLREARFVVENNKASQKFTPAPAAPMSYAQQAQQYMSKIIETMPQSTQQSHPQVMEQVPPITTQVIPKVIHQAPMSPTDRLFFLVETGTKQEIINFFKKQGEKVAYLFDETNKKGRTLLEQAFYGRNNAAVDALIEVLDGLRMTRSVLKHNLHSSSVLDVAIDSGDINMVFKAIALLGRYNILTMRGVLDRAVQKVDNSDDEAIESMVMATQNMWNKLGSSHVHRIFKNTDLTIDQYQKEYVSKY